MDNLTHSLFGLTLARTPLGRVGRGTTAVLFLASNAPDIDIVVTAGGAARYLQFHRGPTHGPLGVIGLGLAVAGLVWGWHRWFEKKNADTSDPPAGFVMLCVIAMLGVVCHVLMDLPTSYGVRPLSPFAWTWFTSDWMPIVDVYLIAILAAGLFFGRDRTGDKTSTTRRRRNTALALVLMMADYGVRATSHHMAVARAPEVFAGHLPPWCTDAVKPSWAIDYWPRTTTPSMPDAALDRCLVEIAAVPDFISPFRWRLIARSSNSYDLRDLDLLGDTRLDTGEPQVPVTQSVRVPSIWTPAVMQAATAPTARLFLGFSRFPAARSFVAADGVATVRWTDMRFLMGPLGNPAMFRSNLFGSTVITGPDGKVRVDRLGP